MVKRIFTFSFLIIFTAIITFSTTNTSFAAKKGGGKKSGKKGGLITGGNKPEWIPTAPSQHEIVYKMLFDDGFANIVEDYAEMGEYGDNDIDVIDLRAFNRMYKAGNDESTSQMEAIEAEKKTIAGEMIDKELVDTERTRVLAYLTADQIEMAGLFHLPSQRAYISAVADDLREERRQEMIALSNNFDL